MLPMPIAFGRSIAIEKLMRFVNCQDGLILINTSFDVEPDVVVAGYQTVS